LCSGLFDIEPAGRKAWDLFWCKWVSCCAFGLPRLAWRVLCASRAKHRGLPSIHGSIGIELNLFKYPLGEGKMYRLGTNQDGGKNFLRIIYD